MPYIKDIDNRRHQLANGCVAKNAGELNYQIFHYVKYNKTPDKNVISYYVKNFLGEKPNYQKYNDMVGCLVCCYKEISRRLGFFLSIIIDILHGYCDEIAIYENEKIIENGDV